MCAIGHDLKSFVHVPEILPYDIPHVRFLGPGRQ